MADITVQYTLTTPGPYIVYNAGCPGDGTNIYYITNIQGLDGAPIRAPIDNAPQADGGLIHTFWKGPRHIIIDGMFLIQSTHVMNSIRLQRNTMESNLTAALDSMYQVSGTLAWTPAGGGAHSITVYNDVPVVYDYADNFLSKTFAFGLVSASSSL